MPRPETFLYWYAHSAFRLNTPSPPSLPTLPHGLLTPSPSSPGKFSPPQKNNKTIREKLEKDVANCHKLPAYDFDRRILPVEEIASRLHKSIANIFRVNPGARVLLTVSPVRHWRDGPVENARSKAHLLAGAHGAIDLLREEGFGSAGVGGPGYCGYFPSFEIMNDDLR